MNIPDEAVETGAKAMRDYVRQHSIGLPALDPSAEDCMRTALEAAAPHIIAEALEEAAEQLEYGNPVGSWLQERADSYRVGAGG